MKILLIKPQRTIPTNFRGVGRIYPSVGLGYIAACLEKAGHEVKILDAVMENWMKINRREDGLKYIGMSYEELKERIKSESPDIVGITGLSVDAINSRNIANVVKSANKDIKVVVGGCHFSVTYNDEINNENIDFICIGEGEITIVELVKALEGKMKLKDVKGLVWKKDGKTIVNESRPFIQNLDELPFPAFHLMNMEKYFKLCGYMQGSHLIPDRHFSIITSRSCPYACIFCSVRTIMGRGFRPRSPENVIKEMELMADKYKVKLLSIEDDNLTFDKKRAEKIFDLMIERGLNKKMKWDTPNGVRADTLDENLLRKMKESGAIRIWISPESGSQKVVDNIIGKKLDLNVVENVVKICQKIGLKISCFFMVGLPGETKEDIEKTITFAERLRSYGATPLCAIVRPTFGTDLYKICKEKGFLIKDKEDLERTLVSFEHEGLIKTDEFTPEELDVYAKRVRGKNEESELRELIRNYPLYIIKLLLIHPIFILKYLYNWYLT